MNDPDNFLARWSRRKRQVAKQPEQPREDQHAPDTDARADPASVTDSDKALAKAPAATEPVFDLTTLPSIESITAETDIRAFLSPGVPTELKLAALRRAWASDPKVRDFVGLADYDWDFHTPGALPGFGPLEMTDDLRREVNRIVGAWQAEAEPSAPTSMSAERSDNDPNDGMAPSPAGAESDTPSASEIVAVADVSPGTQDDLMGTMNPLQRNNNSTATQQDQPGHADSQPTVRSGHGGALPRLPK